MRRALSVGVAALTLYALHYGWFVLFGPPAWFESVGTREPDIGVVQLDSSFDRYLDEFDRPAVATLGVQPAGVPAEVAGQVIRRDGVSPRGPLLVQTREGPRDRLYFAGDSEDRWLEWDAPENGRLGAAVIFGEDPPYQVLWVRFRAWWPHGVSYGRFWFALFQPALRPRSGLWMLDPETGETEYRFPGRNPLPAPDRSRVAFMRSDGHGFHDVHIWHPGSGPPVRVVSLWEADPGSGPSFTYGWSTDSKVLFVRGSSRGFHPSRPHREPETLRLLYDVTGDRLVGLTRR